MIETLLTASGISATWKILGSLHEKYAAWSMAKKNSKIAKEQVARAEILMKQINSKILSGGSSDDPELKVLIREFLALLAQDAKPAGHEDTEEWIARSRKAAAQPAARKAASKKPAAKKAATAKLAAKKVVSKKATAKKTSFRKAAAKSAAVK